MKIINLLRESILIILPPLNRQHLLSTSVLLQKLSCLFSNRFNFCIQNFKKMGHSRLKHLFSAGKSSDNASPVIFAAIFLYKTIKKRIQIFFPDDQSSYSKSRIHNKKIVRQNLRAQMSQASQSEVYAPQGCLSGDQSDNFQQYHRRVQKIDENGIEGKWTDEESILYALYMDHFSKIFASKQKRKSSRIFKSLSTFLTTRTPRQCRSHFQKLMSKYKTLKKVKHFYQEQIGLVKYQQRLTSLSEKIRQSHRKEDEDERFVIETKTVEIQTDPLNIGLSDLSQGQLAKLVKIVQDHQKSQLAYWMTSSFMHPPMPGFGL